MMMTTIHNKDHDSDDGDDDDDEVHRQRGCRDERVL